MSKDLSSPRDLWVLPPPGASNWFTHVDWYLNWQLCKGLTRPSLSLPIQVYRVAEENDLEVPSEKAGENSPLLVLSKGRIPAGKCVVLEYAGPLRGWLTQVRQLAEDLTAKDIQVFLPVGQSIEQAEKIWKALGSGIAAGFLSDEEALA